MAFLEKADSIEMGSVELKSTAKGLVAGETSARFRAEVLSGRVLRLAGITMISGSIVMWFILPVDAETGRIASFGALASIMAALGLGVFAFGTRGIRRQMTLDIDRGTLALTKVNIRDQVRAAQEIDLGEIESVFLRRPEKTDGVATLLVRVAGAQFPTIALTGHTTEVERVHSQLSQVMHLANQDISVNRPSLRLDESSPPRPRLFAR
ncbi:MAG: hypothetical protein AAF922_08705 [Pseudomonadota bacterium]